MSAQRIAAWTAAACIAAGAQATAAQRDIAGPPGTQAFGTAVLVLPNGNLVITDPDYLSGTGAVLLFGRQGNLISRLAGSAQGDRVGSGGVVQVGSTHVVVQSPHWRRAPFADVGAVTWVDGAAGLAGEVDANNSLVGTRAGDAVGTAVRLRNGNYVVISPAWDGGIAVDAGAVTFGAGESGVRGAVSGANSLVGGQINDRIGSDGIVPLTHGDYLVLSPLAKNDLVAEAGAVTLANGATGTAGFVTAANSLVGTRVADRVGSGGATALAKGNFVVASPEWDNGNTVDAGAATFGNGSTGLTGAVSVANSLVGTRAADQVGVGGVTALGNGHYVVVSPTWANGTAANAGAATWGRGDVGVGGPVSALNSLVGTQADDAVGSNGVVALDNGHYVVASPFWRNGLPPAAGAATWGNGASGTTGPVTALNSLVGTQANDLVGSTVVALSNGNYVVASPFWRNGFLTNAGAVTLGDGTSGTTGAVSAANSLVGPQQGDAIGITVTPLSNGNYVVHSPFWDLGATPDVGAITWGSGTFSTTGPVTVFNSMRGLFSTSLASCRFAAWTVANYQYACRNTQGDLAGGVSGVGGAGPTQGLALVNALSGNTGDRIGDGALEIVASDRYVAFSPAWSGGLGAVTLGTLPVLAIEPVDARNSVLGVVPGAGATLVWAYRAARDELVVGQPAVNRVSILDRNAIFAGGFE
jgi:hypothetical protein